MRLKELNSKTATRPQKVGSFQPSCASLKACIFVFFVPSPLFGRVSQFKLFIYIYIAFLSHKYRSSKRSSLQKLWFMDTSCLVTVPSQWNTKMATTSVHDSAGSLRWWQCSVTYSLPLPPHPGISPPPPPPAPQPTPPPPPHPRSTSSETARR